MGLRRAIRMVAAVQGDRFSGRVKQSVQTLYKPPLELAGSLAGQRVKDTVTSPGPLDRNAARRHRSVQAAEPNVILFIVGSMGYTIIEVMFKRDETAAAAAAAAAARGPRRFLVNSIQRRLVPHHTRSTFCQADAEQERRGLPRDAGDVRRQQEP